jgi:hypothetical protein
MEERKAKATTTAGSSLRSEWKAERQKQRQNNVPQA